MIDLPLSFSKMPSHYFPVPRAYVLGLFVEANDRVIVLLLSHPALVPVFLMDISCHCRRTGQVSYSYSRRVVEMPSSALPTLRVLYKFPSRPLLLQRQQWSLYPILVPSAFELMYKG